MIIQKATIKAAQEIHSIVQEAFLLYQKKINTAIINSPILIDALKETVEDVVLDITKNSVLVAKCSGKVIGTVRYKIIDTNTAYIYRFAVCTLPPIQGVGNALLLFVENECKKKGIKNLALHSAIQNKPLVRYYNSFGFKLSSTDFKKGYERGYFVKNL